MNKNLSLKLAGILLITFICYLPVLKAELTNWDDTTHLIDNPSVRSLSFENLKHIFTSTVSQVYMPLTIFTFALEYHFVQYQPFIYHLNNLLLHLIVTMLVFIFLKKLKFPDFAVLMATLLFGIHPMHVESVAWVTERKDVLYALFYMLALIAYLKFLENNNYKYYYLTIFLGWLSISAKTMAVSLPLVLLLVDWYVDKKKGVMRPLLEKIPFLIYCLPIAYITQNMNPETVSAEPHLFKALLIFIWTFSFYISKFFFPFPLIPLYITPEPISLFNPIYAYSLIVFIIFFYLLIKWRAHRCFIFSAMFYLGSIFFLFRFNKLSDMNVVADRFIYLPCLGLCLLIGLAVSRLIEQKESLLQKRLSLFIVLGIILLGILTFRQNLVWQNSLTLWNHQLKFKPNTLLAYNNRGDFYQDNHQLDLALQDFNQALRINPFYAPAYNNRGGIYTVQKKYDLAKHDYLTAIILDKNPYAEAYHNLGRLFLDIKNYDAALVYLNRSIEIDPKFDNAYNTRGTYYTHIHQPLKAIEEFNQALSINPSNVVSLNNRGIIFESLGRHEQAMKDFDQSISINPNYIDSYINKGLLYKKMGMGEEALKNFNLALNLDPQSTKALNHRGLIYIQQNHLEAALNDFNKIIHIDAQFVDAFISRGTILGNQKKYNEAIENYSEGIKLAPDKLILFINRGAVYLMSNNISKALEDFNHVIAINTKESVAYYYRSICHKRLKDYKQALKDAQTAKSLNFQPIDDYLNELQTLILQNNP